MSGNILEYLKMSQNISKCLKRSQTCLKHVSDCLTNLKTAFFTWDLGLERKLCWSNKKVWILVELHGSQDSFYVSPIFGSSSRQFQSSKRFLGKDFAFLNDSKLRRARDHERDGASILRTGRERRSFCSQIGGARRPARNPGARCFQKCRIRTHLCELLEFILILPLNQKSGLGSLSSNNRLRDRFSCSKSRQTTGQRFSGRISDRKAEQVLKAGDRNLNRALDSLFEQNRVPCPVWEPVLRLA